MRVYLPILGSILCVASAAHGESPTQLVCNLHQRLGDSTHDFTLDEAAKTAAIRIRGSVEASITYPAVFDTESVTVHVAKTATMSEHEWVMDRVTLGLKFKRYSDGSYSGTDSGKCQLGGAGKLKF